MSEHLKGILITTLGVLLVVPDSLFVRLIDADPMVTAFWRGATSGLLILIFALFWNKPSGFMAVAETGWKGLIYAFLIGSTTIGFVLAVTNTSVANVVFIFACMPIFAAVLSWLFLGEKINARMVWTMVAVIGGLGVIAYGTQSSAIASWKGDLWALYVAFAYAAALTTIRKVKSVSMIPAIPVGYLGAAIVLSLFVDPFKIFDAQWPLLLGHGFFIATATCFLTLGPRYISASEVALLILLESVLAPLLVWAVIGEAVGFVTLIGGALVIGALLISNLIAMRAKRGTA